MQILEQPNGKLCVYSAKENKMLLEDAEDTDVILYLVDIEIKEKVKNIVERTKDMISSARHNKEALHEFFTTYEEASKKIRESESMQSNERSTTHAKIEALKRADALGCKLNANEVLVNKIVNALQAARVNYGDAYCPCSILKNKSTICCCDEWKKALENNSMAYCHCKLYFNPNFRKD